MRLFIAAVVTCPLLVPATVAEAAFKPTRSATRGETVTTDDVTRTVTVTFTRVKRH